MPDPKQTQSFESWWRTNEARLAKLYLVDMKWNVYSLLKEAYEKDSG